VHACGDDHMLSLGLEVCAFVIACTEGPGRMHAHKKKRGIMELLEDRAFS
jgi:hypothetical protein